MDRKDLIQAIGEDVRVRTDWEERQAKLFRARYRGLRRSNLPWPGASDTNWPLIDTIIEKLKPYYVQQLYATELIASFVPHAGDPGTSAQLASSAAQWFDFMLKQESNLEREMIFCVDYQLMQGRPAMKVTWDVDKARLVFSVVEPTCLIVPPSTTDIEDADRLVHVLRFTPDAYRRQEGFNRSEDFIKRITGKGTDGNGLGSGTRWLQDKASRQGITFGADDQIIVWEIWSRPDGKTWEVECVAPVCPEETVKPKVTNVFDHGVPPFADFPNELTQPDWYSPRGVGEIVLPWQAQLTKLLNEKNDALTISTRPFFESDSEVPNAGNWRMRPGQILPRGVRPAAFPAPPVDFERHIMLMRSVAEELVKTPDFGMAKPMDLRRARTATEMEQIASLNEQSSDLRGRVFRMSLGKLYGLAWSTLKQYAGGRLNIWVDDALKAIPQEALRGTFSVRPSGSADGITRQTMWRRAVARMQMFANDPFIDQGELRKSVLEADDSGLVMRLFRDPGLKQMEETEEQAAEIAVMKLGFPAFVSQGDDHPTHIRTLLQYVTQQNQAGQSPTPFELQLIQSHLADHVQQLKRVDPEMAKAAMDAIAVVGQMVAGQGQPQQGAENAVA